MDLDLELLQKQVAKLKADNALKLVQQARQQTKDLAAIATLELKIAQAIAEQGA